MPIIEEKLLSGSFEPTNEGYALAKTAGIKLCCYFHRQYGDKFISCIPANVYGPNDNFNGSGGHVVPMLMARMHEAKIKGSPVVVVWGTGKAEREFMYIDDAASACVYLLEHTDLENPVNIGVGKTTTIKELAELLRQVVGYDGEIAFDTSKPDGMRGRLLDSSRINELGWRPRISLKEGLAETYRWYLENCTPVNLAEN